jgi:hypothetical protein
MDTPHGVFERAAKAGVAMRFDDRDADETLGLICRFGNVHRRRIVDMRWANLYPILFVEGDDLGANRASYL